MRNTTIRTAIATIAIGLASAGSIEAGHDARSARDPLLRLATDVEASTRALYKEAERFSDRRSNPAERQALRQLADLSYQTRSFRRMLANDGPYSVRVEREFRELEVALRRVQRSFPALCPDRELRRDFRDVNRLLAELDFGFESRLARFQERGRYGKTRPSGHVSIAFERRF